jgi:hypothetical protein
MKVDTSYRQWRKAVNRHLVQLYCITIHDAGLDEGYLLDRWHSEEAPLDFVRWFGNKYDLDPMLPLLTVKALTA